MSRMLPAYQIKHKEIYSTEYQFYQSIKDEPFAIQPQTTVSICNSSLLKFNIKVEYLSLKQISDYYVSIYRQYNHRPIKLIIKATNIPIVIASSLILSKRRYLHMKY